MPAAIVFGPTVLGGNEKFQQKMFPKVGSMMLTVYQLLGFMLYYFLVGVRTDVTMVKYSGKLAFVIGFTTFFFPILITTSVALFMTSTTNMDGNLKNSLPIIASIESTTSFHVIAALLGDLKLLNSELGRLALSSSLISDILSLAHVLLVFYLKESSHASSRQALLATNLSRVVMILVILFVFRPIMFWIIKRTPEGKSLKEGHICLIFVMVLLCSFFGEVAGIDFMIGPLIFGMAIPNGPPIATSLMEKLGCFISLVLVPCYFIHISLKINVVSIRFDILWEVVFIIIVATLSKVVAIMIPSIYHKMPLVDAFALGLIMNFKGLFDVQTYDRARHFEVISDEVFEIMVIMAMFHTAIFTSLVRALYDPSRRYIAYKRHTIQHAKRNTKLTIIACVHQQEDVPSIINLLDITNPTIDNPIELHVLNLVELSGRSSPLFITHQFDKFHPSSNRSTRFSHLINAFHKFQLQALDTVTVQCYTAISPYTTMHDDICTLALEKSSSMVIIPFRPSDSHSIRTVNRNVLEMAPCSIGILISSDVITSMASCLANFNIYMLFIHGPDDREALAYATRMAEHSLVKLTVIRILGVVKETYGSTMEKKFDNAAINEIELKIYDNKRIVYKEEQVMDVSDTARVIRSLENQFDLILVGRRHDYESEILKGMGEWSEIKELGVVGDLLVTVDYTQGKGAVLVVQQQASVVEEMVESPRLMISKESSKKVNLKLSNASA